MTGLLHEYAQLQAERRPDATAIKLGDDAMTYSELASTSNQLARSLIDGGCRPGDRVAILMPKSPHAIVAMHAVMIAGGVYVPIDAGSPAIRVARVLAASAPRWLLASGSSPAVVDRALEDYPHPLPRVGWLELDPVHGDRYRADLSLTEVYQQPTEASLVRRDSSDPAHILFTSGSTGIPKGVVISHGNVTAFVEWAIAYFGITAEDRMSGHSPLHFDLSTFDIYGAFAAGAELHLVPSELNLMAPKLAQFIRDSKLTQWFSVPSLLTYMASFDAVRQDDFATLKRVIWCGEVFPTAPLIHWMDRLPHATFTNLYGPTEATIASSFHTLATTPSDAAASVPIGLPCAGEELLVLDQDLSPTPIGGIGDLYIGGVGLSPGYWQDTQATEAAFIDHAGRRIYRTGDMAAQDEEGLVTFHGRSDSQIKSRGHRIELGEIEAALAIDPVLRESAVVAVATEGFEGFAICCAYVPVDSMDVTPLIIRKSLSKSVPSYMIPSRWRAFERLPKNANGKIDKPSLRDAFQEQA